MCKSDDTQDHGPSRGLRNRMNDIHLEFIPPELLRFRRTGPNSWEAPGTDFTLSYCNVNSWFVAYKGVQALFTARTLEQADELLQGLPNATEEP